MVAGCGANCIKYLLFFFNVLFFLFGLLLVAMGAYAMIMIDAVSQSGSSEDQAAIKALVWLGAIIFLIVGGILVVICFLGCCGAIKEVKCMLGMYAVLLGIVIIAELVFVVRLFMIKGLLSGVVNIVQERVVQYTGEKNANTDNVDYLHQANKCCGAETYKEFKTGTYWVDKDKYEVPMSCCVLNTEKTSDITMADLMDPDCVTNPTVINSYISSPCLSTKEGAPGLLAKMFNIIVGVVFGLIAIELIGIVFAIFLICQIRNTHAVPV